MEDKVVLVTGATSGIGRATAIAFGRKGASVVLCGRREDKGEESAELVRQAGGQALFVRCDVTDETAVAELVQKTVSTFGQLDYAFNNAGGGPPPGPMLEIPRAEWDQTIAVNLTGTWLCMQHELRQMVPNGGGVIVNMASVGGKWGTPGLAPYVAAKHGIIGLTKTAAMEYAKANVRVNVVAPAGIRTEILEANFGANEAALAAFANFHPMGRLGEADEVANAVVWLCSPEASFINGTTLMIDSGVTAGVNPFGG